MNKNKMENKYLIKSAHQRDERPKTRGGKTLISFHCQVPWTRSISIKINLARTVHKAVLKSHALSISSKVERKLWERFIYI